MNRSEIVCGIHESVHTCIACAPTILSVAVEQWLDTTRAWRVDGSCQFRGIEIVQNETHFDSPASVQRFVQALHDMRSANNAAVRARFAGRVASAFVFPCVEDKGFRYNNVPLGKWPVPALHEYIDARQAAARVLLAIMVLEIGRFGVSRLLEAL